MRRAFKFRVRVIAAVLVGISSLLILRLYFVQIVHGGEYALRAERQYISSSQQLYDRGSIFFTRKDGTLISAATLATGFLVAIDPERLGDPAQAYTQIASKISVDKTAFMASAAKTNDPYEVVAHHVSDADGRVISDMDIPGVIVTRERWRIYPAGNAAAQTIGLVAYDNDNTLAGRYGLERYYNDTLTREGEGVFGNFFAELFANLDNVVVDARASREGDVITSIEPVVQQELDKQLAATQAKYSSKETGGIIMDPSTGEIIALDVVPNFDPNDFKGEDPATFENHLVERQYEFGSIVKVLTMATGLDTGVITPDTTYNDTGCIIVNASKICNYDLRARGVIPMQQILSQSLNVGASFIATRVGHDGMRHYFEALGFGTPTHIDLTGEVSGDVHNLNSPRDVEYDTASFGQGIAATPVQMIRALGAIANHGAIVTPHLAKAIRLQSGVIKTLDWGKPQQVFKPSTADEVATMLVYVVDHNLANGKDKIDSMTVGTKTGTAQMASPNGGYYKDRYFHSFFGFFPAYQPRFVILLYTLEPQNVEYASETLTDPFIHMTHFLTNYYQIPPDRASYQNETSS